MNLWHLIFFIFFFVNQIKSGKIRPNFDEIFGNEWDKKESEDILIKTKQNKRNDNSQSAAVGQMGDEMGTKPIGEKSEYSNQNVIKDDQNTREEQNDKKKNDIIQKFEAIKEKLKQKKKIQRKNNNKIECKIAKLLGTNRQKIYKWKKEMNLNKIKMMGKSFYKDKKEEFIGRIDEFKSLYRQGKQKEFVKELGISERTFLRWKKELLPNCHKTMNNNPNDFQLKKIKQYFEIKEKNPKIRDEIIAMKLKIRSSILRRWTKEFGLNSIL